MTFLLGTRGSALAMAQAEMVRAKIAGILNGEGVRLEPIKTLGDQLGVSPGVMPSSSEPQGIFTRELDEALLSGKIQAAVHSLKDVPTVLPEGIVYGAFLSREEPRDALISAGGKMFRELLPGSRLGTSSPRREAQIHASRPDLTVIPMRGNVDTRIKKLKKGEADAIIVAAAGLIRLGRREEITELLEPDVFLPAPAQGILCVTILGNNRELLSKLGVLNDSPTEISAEAERAFLKKLQGGCRVPVGALAHADGNELVLSGFIADPKGTPLLRGRLKGPAQSPVELGISLADDLLRNGAKGILKNFFKM